MKTRVHQVVPGLALGEAMGGFLREVGEAVATYATDPAGGAHLIRVRMKRLQALSHLVPRGGAWRRQMLPLCRELKDAFAATRDATILRVLSEEHGYHGDLPPLVAPTPDLERAGVLVTAAVAALESCQEWPRTGWEELVERAARSYRLARVAWREAARKDAPDAGFHRLRRRVKRLLYQCEFLAGWADSRGIARDLERLGEVLGGLQDVCMAQAWLSSHNGTAWPALRRLRKKLRRRALRKADKLFGTSARQFRRRHLGLTTLPSA